MGSDLAIATRGLTSERVSIHAPAWGATGDQWKKDYVDFMFQFTLPHGERRAATTTPVRADAFQFTLPHGERRRRRPRRSCAVVSIHAPAWGATNPHDAYHEDTDSFNSRSRMGSDRRPAPRPAARGGFNSRSRMGSDSRTGGALWCTRCFNSRSRMGSDPLRDRAQGGRSRFNSRSRMGSDLLLTWLLLSKPSFNSRSRMGSDR